MTRFARAKGSKSCNARVEEDSTSWSEFKRQIEEKKYHSTNAGTSSNTSAETFLKKYKAETPSETCWADFGDEQGNNNLRKKSSKKRKLHNVDSEEQVDRKKKEKLEQVDQSVSFESSKKRSKKHKPSSDDIVDGVSLGKEEEVKEDLVDKSGSFQPPKKRPKKHKSPNDDIVDSISLEQEEEVKVDQVDQSDDVKNKPSKSKKKKNRNKPIPNNENPEDNLKNLKEGAICKEESNVNQENQKNVKGNKPHKRRKPFVQSSTIHINGVSIQITKFDGFDVKTEDALRLKELRSKMLKEGIPKAEVDIVIKRERRNAEKALSREKKKVCFNCRRAGHLLSECPEIGSSSSKNYESDISHVNSGSIKLCYKCGSTEHTHFQCKVEKKDKYSFATCFICKEQGHISSQCPDNPKGLYPQGGCCKVCGEVTHLKKDCPKLSKERSENTVTLDTLPSESNPDSFAEKGMAIPQLEKKASPKKQKVIKF